MSKPSETIELNWASEYSTSTGEKSLKPMVFMTMLAAGAALLVVAAAQPGRDDRAAATSQQSYEVAAPR